jgi:cytochrome c biogenesis protein
MKLFSIKQSIRFLTDLRVAILILALIAGISSLGSILEQDETLEFYQQMYPSEQPIYGFIDWKFLTLFGLDHIFSTAWFFFLLLLLGISLIGCTITRQFPIFINSKDYLFKQTKPSFQTLPFFVQIQNISYLEEFLLLKMQAQNFYLYQKGNVVYGYKGLIGRISPILVHFSLIIILIGSSIGAVKSLKAQEVLPKGEVFHIQNPIKLGFFSSLPPVSGRVNDFWVEYKKNRIHQFYSNLSILDSYGNEIVTQTVSVNNPLRYKQIDFYQSDWNLLGIRIAKFANATVATETPEIIYEFPLFSFNPNSTPGTKAPKSWITWVISPNTKENFTLIFDQLQNVFFVYDQKGQFVRLQNLGDFLTPTSKIIEILPSTGLLIKYDPSIQIIYFGFGVLMLTACLSYLPYTQIWLVSFVQNSWVGCATNRGKIQLEIEFENLIRFAEKKILLVEKINTK